MCVCAQKLNITLVCVFMSMLCSATRALEASLPSIPEIAMPFLFCLHISICKCGVSLPFNFVMNTKQLFSRVWITQPAEYICFSDTFLYVHFNPQDIRGSRKFIPVLFSSRDDFFLKRVMISNRGFTVKTDDIFFFFMQLSRSLQVTGSQLRKCLIMMENPGWIS